MTLRPLVLNDPHTLAEVARVKAHARANHYGKGKPIPGDNPAFVAHLSTYRCVFTYTAMNGKLYRDLSVSVPSDKLPNPAAVFTIATMFGFTGHDINKLDEPGSGWGVHVEKASKGTDAHIRVAQPITQAEYDAEEKPCPAAAVS